MDSYMLGKFVKNLFIEASVLWWKTIKDNNSIWGSVVGRKVLFKDSGTSPFVHISQHQPCQKPDLNTRSQWSGSTEFFEHFIKPRKGVHSCFHSLVEVILVPDNTGIRKCSCERSLIPGLFPMASPNWNHWVLSQESYLCFVSAPFKYI